MAREMAAHHKPCKGGDQISPRAKPPLLGPPSRQRATTACSDHNLPATKVTQICIPQEVERKTRCSSLMVVEGSVSAGTDGTGPGTGPSMSAKPPPNSLPSCCHLAVSRKLSSASQACLFTGALELTQLQPLPSPTATHPTGLQTRFSNPVYLRGRALRQHLVNGRFGWTFSKVQPKLRLALGSRNKQKVNKKGKRKPLKICTATPQPSERPFGWGQVPLFKNNSSFCTL